MKNRKEKLKVKKKVRNKKKPINIVAYSIKKT